MQNTHSSFPKPLYILFALFFAFAGFSYAEEEREPVNTSVYINSTFGLSVKPLLMDFGEADPGYITPSKKITVECITNNNNAWAVSLHAASSLSSEEFTIPDENFLWVAETKGLGTLLPGSGHITTEPFEFYIADSSEYITIKPVKLVIGFRIDVPPAQPTGKYETAVIFTVYEK